VELSGQGHSTGDFDRDSNPSSAASAEDASGERASDSGDNPGKKGLAAREVQVQEYFQEYFQQEYFQQEYFQQTK
jgi:hypothetical protein